MTEDVACVSTDAPVPEIARTMRQNRIHRVLVIEEGVLRGIISTSDMVALLERGE
jgi:CBS domain-containing protein